jgi:cytidylate kinase
MPPAPDAHLIDTGGMDAGEVVEIVLALARERTA